jgi:DNA-binding NarL/FixJ family response regulator
MKRSPGAHCSAQARRTTLVGMFIDEPNGPARQVRVLIVDLPGLLRGIVRATVEGQPDMAVVGEVPGDMEIWTAVEETGADVVVVDATHPVLEDPGPAYLSARTPASQILALSADGRESFLYALRRAPVALGELSPAHLAAVIRAGEDYGDRE